MLKVSHHASLLYVWYADVGSGRGTSLPEQEGQDELEDEDKENKLDCYYVVLAIVLGGVLLGVLIYFSGKSIYVHGINQMYITIHG